MKLYLVNHIQFTDAELCADELKITGAYRIAVMMAAHDGCPVQISATRPYGSRQWLDEPTPRWDWGSYIYRIKPEPKPKVLRAWDYDKVPLGVMCRWKDARNETSVQYRYMIIAADHRGIHFGGGMCHSASATCEDMEHSTDGGKTWLPCGVYE